MFFLAFRCSEVSRLQNLAFLPNVWQFSIDVIVLQMAITATQMVGFVLLFLFYGGMLGLFLLEERTQRSEKDDATNDFKIV